jgi:hypothetical protein
MRLGDRGDLGELGRHFRLGSLDFDDQHRLDVEWIAGMSKAFANLDGEPVHIFHRDGDQAGADDGGHGLAGFIGRIETEQNGARAFGSAQQADHRLGDNPKLALRADHQAEKIQSAGIQMRATELDDLAIERHHRQAEDIIGGDAIFQAMRAARIHADIAADRAGELGRRIGRVEKAVCKDRVGNRQIGDAGLNARITIGKIDLEDPVHLGQADDDSVLLRNGAAGERRAGAARHE